MSKSENTFNWKFPLFVEVTIILFIVISYCFSFAAVARINPDNKKIVLILGLLALIFTSAAAMVYKFNLELSQREIIASFFIIPGLGMAISAFSLTFNKKMGSRWIFSRIRY